MSAFAAPPYGAGTLSDLLPAVLASLAVPGEVDVLGLEPARAACVLLVDGLGAELLARSAAHAPALAALLDQGRTLRAGFPSTTATSVASLWTGRPPGEHGLLGLKVAVPEQGRLLNLLRWEDDPDPRAWQPLATVPERAVAAGVRAAAVVPRAFEGSGLTTAAYRGVAFVPAQTAGEQVAAVERELRAGSLVYAYYGDLDGVGHRRGCGSEEWALQLEHVERLVLQLVARLPEGAALHVVADHGMLDLDPGECVDVADDPVLLQGVALLGGEPRARHVYTVPGSTADVQAGWREVLGDRAEVWTRDEAVALGWFGPRVLDRVRDRIGDVVVAARGRAGVLDTAADAYGSALIGHHGSLSDAEQSVPLITVRG